MKTNTINPNPNRRMTVGVVTSLLLALILAAANSRGAAPSAAARRADPFAKGAAGLMEKPVTEQLKSELDIPELAGLHYAWESLPREMVRCATLRSNHTVHVAIHRVHASPDRPVLVLIHGVLSDHLTWRYVAGELARDYEIWLVDLPGCGDSDAPKPNALEPDGYSPTALGERVMQALQQCLASEPAGLSRHLTLVGHSLGGTVVLRMMSAPELRAGYPGVIQHVDRVVLFAPGDVAINSVPPQFRTLLGLKGWKVGLGEALGVMESKVRDLTKASYHRPEYATREQQDCQAHILKDAGHREAAKAMLRQFVPFDAKTMRPVWAGIDPLVADYKNLRVPVLIAHGVWDETLSVATGHKLKNQIPGAWLVEVPHSSHALPTEQPAICADLIRRFVTESGELTLPPGSELTVYPGSPAVPRALADYSSLGKAPNQVSLNRK